LLACFLAWFLRLQLQRARARIPRIFFLYNNKHAGCVYNRLSAVHMQRIRRSSWRALR
jgi:hypothetical protein